MSDKINECTFIQVQCTMYSGYAVSIITHNTMKWKYATQTNKAYGFKWTIQYNRASWQQIKSLVATSQFCYQDIKLVNYEIENTQLTINYSIKNNVCNM